MQRPCLSLAHFSTNSFGTVSFSHCGNCHSPQSALSLSFPLNQPQPRGRLPHCSQLHLHGPPPCPGFSLSTTLPVCFLCLMVSLIPWLSEFHAVWFSGTSGCLLILDCLLSSFWFFKEAKGSYLHLHLGQKSQFTKLNILLSMDKSRLSLKYLVSLSSPIITNLGSKTECSWFSERKIYLESF